MRWWGLYFICCDVHVINFWDSVRLRVPTRSRARVSGNLATGSLAKRDVAGTLTALGHAPQTPPIWTTVHLVLGDYREGSKSYTTRLVVYLGGPRLCLVKHAKHVSPGPQRLIQYS